MDQRVTLLGTPNIHFVSLIIIGGLAGWIGGMIVGWRHGLSTNILVGIAGSWIGSELASMSDFAIYGSLKQFLAALVGSIILLIVWRALSSRSAAY
ncbi:MAG: GlsB/YeaQ/YmgE family stress response membrane protein [Roseiarcus sp.]|uniref:GlsB/YeaQ/YmgE family stress response membrane protein n=1 Tax=Roseiarcus sp. TaxID=1969460 RepID=UPI003C5D0A47